MNAVPDDEGWILDYSQERDIDALMKWFPDRESILVWGGPTFRYPFNRHSFAEDVHWGRMASFSLRGAAGELAAFGQVYKRYGRIHFARLVTHPGMRGQGVGKRLLTMMMKATASMPDCEEYSLFVFRDNEPAYRCYLSMGFAVVAYPEDAPMADKCYYLTRPKEADNDNNKGANNDC